MDPQSQQKWISLAVEQLQVGEPLPGNLYLHIANRFILYRAKGDVLDRNAYDRLEFKKVDNLFVLEEDHPAFLSWADGPPAEPAAPEQQAAEQAHPEYNDARKDAQRKMLDIFQSHHPEKFVAEAIAASKKLVTEVMKLPFAMQSLGALQKYSRGTVDHSVNVAILSVYLANQMGYSHGLILQHVGLGALLHDIGKRKVNILKDDSPEAIAAKMREHPTLGQRLLEGLENVPNEVKMIVAQHHEFHDGNGYPGKMRGNQIYDLAKIVAISNVFDELVSVGQGPLAKRQKEALGQLDQRYSKFDPDKLEKTLRILSLGI